MITITERNALFNGLLRSVYNATSQGYEVVHKSYVDAIYVLYAGKEYLIQGYSLRKEMERNIIDAYDFNTYCNI